MSCEDLKLPENNPVAANEALRKILTQKPEQAAVEAQKWLYASCVWGKANEYAAEKNGPQTAVVYPQSMVAPVAPVARPAQVQGPKESSEHQKSIDSISAILKDLIKTGKVASKEQIASLNRALDSIPKNAQIPVSGEGSLAKKLHQAFWIQKSPQWEVMGGQINTHTLRFLLGQPNGSQVSQGTSLVSETLGKKGVALTPEQKKIQSGSIDILKTIAQWSAPRNQIERNDLVTLKKVLVANLWGLPEGANIKLANYTVAYNTLVKLGVVGGWSMISGDGSISARDLASAVGKVADYNTIHVEPRRIADIQRGFNK